MSVCDNMLGMATFTLYLPDDMVQELDELRGEKSRSAVIRGALGAMLSLAHAEAQATRVRASREAPVDVPVAGMADLQRRDREAEEVVEREQARVDPALSRAEAFARATQRKP